MDAESAAVVATVTTTLSGMKTQPVPDPTLRAPDATPDGAPEPPKRRVVRRDRVRAELIAIGLDFFRQKGFDATTVSDIAAAAGLSQRTFFRYFGCKEDLVFDWMDRQGDFMVPALRARPLSESPLKAMMEAFLQLADEHERHATQAHFRSQLIFETPSLGARFHEDQAKWGGQMAEALMHHAKNAAERYALRVQVAIAITAYVVAMRSWAGSAKGGSPRPWVEQAFAAINDASMPEAPAAARRAGRKG